ncbi:MAG: sugar transferase [Bacteroidales bacterium]|jgi:lipopolysaccharide/colanic/teichoic acid biosynthesis glycosyltransferase
MNLSAQKLRNSLKTLIDYFVTLLSLILLIPVIAILSVLVKMSGKGPVIYSQKRIGRSGKPFDIYKFRTMHYETDKGTTLLSDKGDKRITRLGRFMRKHKFDEIPNLINVLKGEMSLIGPRPEQQFYIDQIVRIEPRYRQLQILKPGITSWGQVKYGYASNVDEMIKRFEYDLFYLENRSLWFDLKIAFYTLAIIFKGQGI